MIKRVLINLRLETRKLAQRLVKPLARDLAPEFPADFQPSTVALCRAVTPYTMTSKERIACIESSLRYLVRHAIPGDIVECGVAAGGSMMAAALTLRSLGDTTRTLYLYDTFAGMPAPGEQDVGITGKSALPTYNKRLVDGVSTWINHPLDTVKRNLHGTGYPQEKMVFIEGKVEETLPDRRPQQIAMLRLDTDWYASTRAELEYLFPLLSPGGVLLLDDYNRWLGSRQAVDEYFDSQGIRMFLSRIDDHAVVGVKTVD